MGSGRKLHLRASLQVVVAMWYDSKHQDLSINLQRKASVKAISFSPDKRKQSSTIFTIYPFPFVSDTESHTYSAATILQLWGWKMQAKNSEEER